MDPTSLLKRYRAIIADDDPIFRYTLRAVEQEACEVIAEAENGLAALQAAEALLPDLVFLDISMPVLDGFQAAVQFRRNLPTVRIIVVSSHSDEADVEEAFLSGAQAYVTKGSAVFKYQRPSRQSWAAGRFGPATNFAFLSISHPASAAAFLHAALA
jgi:DNA-binding NarL/FixJ family response regulator